MLESPTHWELGAGQWRDVGGGRMTKGPKETFVGDSYVHYLDYSDGFIDQKLSNCTLQVYLVCFS